MDIQEVAKVADILMGIHLKKKIPIMFRPDIPEYWGYCKFGFLSSGESVNMRIVFSTDLLEKSKEFILDIIRHEVAHAMVIEEINYAIYVKESVHGLRWHSKGKKIGLTNFATVLS